MGDIVEQVMAIAKEADMKSYLLAYLGFDKYLEKFETATELTADDIGDFVGQKIAVALEEILPQIIQLQEYGEDIKLIVAIYNNSPLATGFAGIEGTGTVEDIFKTVIGLITGVIDALIAETGLEFKLPPQFDGQTFGELAIDKETASPPSSPHDTTCRTAAETHQISRRSSGRWWRKSRMESLTSSINWTSGMSSTKSSTETPARPW